MNPDSLAQLTVADFLDRLASNAPTPGGGSAAALAGALAASLGRMVAAFTMGRPKFASVEAEVRELDQRLARAAELLRRLLDEDAAAYGVLSAAFKLDKTDPTRPARVREAAAVAAQVPLETVGVAASVRTAVNRLLTIGNPLLRSDAQAAGHLAHAAVGAAAANVRANIPLLSPEDGRDLEQQLAAFHAPAAPAA